MDGHRLQELIYRGNGHAARHIGNPCAVYRPQNSTAPLTNQVTSLPITFNASNPNYTKPQLYGKAVWYADMDGRTTLPGDYLVRQFDDKIWYIAAQQQLLPIVAIECNRRIRVVRTPPLTGSGQLGYSGIIDPVDALGTKDSLWPCSILAGGKPIPAANLPSDVRDAGWKILLPISVPLLIRSADLIEDDIGRGFAVGSAELTDLGWRLEVNETHT